MRHAPLAFAFLIAATAGSMAWAQPQPDASRPIDAQRFYSGTWAEIGRRPMKLTDGCVAGATAYVQRDATHVDVRDTCHDGSPAGRLKAIGGPAEILDAPVNAKLRVHYRLFGLFPVTREYWVLDHDEDYRWFISADPTFHDLWIYARDPALGPEARARLTARAAALGYDVKLLEFPAQPAG